MDKQQPELVAMELERTGFNWMWEHSGQQTTCTGQLGYQVPYRHFRVVLIHSGFTPNLCNSTFQIGALRLKRLSDSGHTAGRRGPELTSRLLISRPMCLPWCGIKSLRDLTPAASSVHVPMLDHHLNQGCPARPPAASSSS